MTVLLTAGVSVGTGCGVCSEDHVVLSYCPGWPVDVPCLLLGSGKCQE